MAARTLVFASLLALVLRIEGNIAEDDGVALLQTSAKLSKPVEKQAVECATFPGRSTCDGIDHLHRHAMSGMDSNSDGALTKDESPAMVHQCDHSADGVVDACEFHQCLIENENVWLLEKHHAGECDNYVELSCNCSFAEGGKEGLYLEVTEEAEKEAAQFAVGERVRCRQHGHGWKVGVVTSVAPLRVKKEGYHEDFTWDQVRKLEARKFAATECASCIGCLVGGTCRDAVNYPTATLEHCAEHRGTWCAPPMQESSHNDVVDTDTSLMVIDATSVDEDKADDEDDDDDDDEDDDDKPEIAKLGQSGEAWVCPNKCKKSKCKTGANGVPSTTNHNKEDDCKQDTNVKKCKKKACQACPKCSGA